MKPIFLFPLKPYTLILSFLCLQPSEISPCVSWCGFVLSSELHTFILQTRTLQFGGFFFILIVLIFFPLFSLVFLSKTLVSLVLVDCFVLSFQLCLFLTLLLSILCSHMFNFKQELFFVLWKFWVFWCFFVLMGSIFSNSCLSSLRMSMIIFFFKISLPYISVSSKFFILCWRYNLHTVKLTLFSV